MHLRLVFAASLLFAAACAPHNNPSPSTDATPSASSAKKPSPQKQKFHFHKESEDRWGYAEAVKTGTTLHISGVVGAGPYKQHLHQIYSALEQVLNHYGADFSHVVKENLYTLHMDSVKAHVEVRKAFYKGDYPAATWVQVDRLFMPEYLTEVELVAEIPDGK
jgi:enamine deaminase RidA (YjgF/YER057c/UK114 family)